MKDKKTKNSKFPKGFFTSIKSNNTNHSKNPKEYDKPFEWRKNVLNGKSIVKIVSNKN